MAPFFNPNLIPYALPLQGAGYYPRTLKIPNRHFFKGTHKHITKKADLHPEGRGNRYTFLHRVPTVNK